MISLDPSAGKAKSGDSRAIVEPRARPTLLQRLARRALPEERRRENVGK
jgi:hypothetical protein